MSYMYSDILKVSEVKNIINGRHLSRLEITYKGKVYDTLGVFLEAHDILESDYMYMRALSYSVEACLLFFTGELDKLNKSLADNMHKKAKAESSGTDMQ